MSNPDQVKNFYLVDDRSENFIVGSISRRNSELVQALQELAIGSYHKIDEHRAWQRSS